MRIGGLVVGGKLDRYVGGLFLAAYATSLLLIVGLVIILDVASNLDWFEEWESGARVPALTVVRYYLLQSPFLYLQVAPLVTVVAGMFTVMKLVKHRENIAAKAAGISSRRLIAPVMLGGVAAAFGMFGLRELATERLGYIRDTLYDVLEHRRTERVFENVWLRDVGGNVFRLREFRPAAGDPPVAEIRGLQATFEQAGVLKTLRADRAVWTMLADGPGWLLDGGILKETEDDTRTRAVRVMEGLDFSPRDVLVSVKGEERPMELSYRELGVLSSRDPDNVSYQTLLQYNLTFPLANLVLLMVAVPWMLGRERGKRLEGLMVGCLFCVFYFCLEFFTRALGMDGDLSPLMASWLPILIFGSLGIVLMESIRT